MAKVVRKRNSAVHAKLDKALKGLEDIELKVGWFETTRYEDGTPVAYVATIHEFGAPSQGIPARPFMRPTVADRKEGWRDFVENSAEGIFNGTQTAGTMFEMLGLAVSGDIAKTISQVMAPPLKPATIRAKERKMAQGGVGSLDKPLVETGLMITSVTHTVEEK